MSRIDEHQDPQFEDVREIFSQHGMRCTKQRMQVYKALRTCKAHPTAEELHSMLDSDCAECNISLATVYNTLELLESAGRVVRMQTCAGARYDAITAPHLHLTLPNGRIIDAPEQINQKLLSAVTSDIRDEIARVTGYKVNGIALQVFVDPADSSRACDNGAERT